MSREAGILAIVVLLVLLGLVGLVQLIDEAREARDEEERKRVNAREQVNALIEMGAPEWVLKQQIEQYRSFC